MHDSISRIFVCCWRAHACEATRKLWLLRLRPSLLSLPPIQLQVPLRPSLVTSPVPTNNLTRWQLSLGSNGVHNSTLEHDNTCLTCLDENVTTAHRLISGLVCCPAVQHDNIFLDHGKSVGWGCDYTIIMMIIIMGSCVRWVHRHHHHMKLRANTQAQEHTEDIRTEGAKNLSNKHV